MSTRAQTLPAATPRASVGGSSVLTRKFGGVPGWAWFAGAALGAYVVIRYLKGKKSATGTTATGSSAGTQPTTVYVTTPTTGGGGSSGGGGGGVANPPGAPTPPTTASPVSTQAAGTQPPTITINGTKFDVLGNVGGTTGYTVYGGAPVYFGNANSVAQGPTADKPGAFEYTPATTTPKLIYKRGTPPP